MVKKSLFFIVICLICLINAQGYSDLPSAKGENHEEVVGPQLRLNTYFLDFGIVEPGMEVSRKVEVTNAGQGVLNWKVLHGKKGEKLPYYLSLYNGEIVGSGHYQVPSMHREVIELNGLWMERKGWPVMPAQGVLKYHFYGTGITVHYWRHPEGGVFSFLCDQYWLGEVDTRGEKQERTWVHCVEHLPLGRHTLTLKWEGGSPMFVGFEVTGREVQWGAKQQVKFLPDSGVTTREVDYVTIVLSPQHLSPGIYGYVVSFQSNGGNENVYLTWEVKSEGQLKFIDVFRYVSPREVYLFTTNPQEDERIIRKGNYRKEGVAFRLFPPGTPGTVEFYRWYHPGRDSYFYTHNKREVEKMESGYVLEGAVGNVATTRLKNTRELYRWHNPKTRFFFYTPVIKDPALPRGYQFDGIAGYIPN